MQSKTNGFRNLKRLAAYLRQVESSMHFMIPSNTVINRQVFLFFQEIFFQLFSRNFVEKKLKNFVNLQNISSSAEEFRQPAEYSSLLSMLPSLLTRFRHNRLTDFAWKFLMGTLSSNRPTK